MVQSPSWEANWFAASQEIPRIPRNPKVHYRSHKRPPPLPVLGQPNPVHIPTSHLLEIRSNIIHPSTPRSPNWSPSLRFPHQDPIHSPLLTHTCHMPSPSHSSRFYHPHNIRTLNRLNEVTKFWGDCTLSTQQLWLKSDNGSRNVTRWPTCFSRRILGITLEWQLFQTNLIKSCDFQDYILPVVNGSVGVSSRSGDNEIQYLLVYFAVVHAVVTWHLSCIMCIVTIHYSVYNVLRGPLASSESLATSTEIAQLRYFKTFRVLNSMFTDSMWSFIRCESTLLFEVLYC